MKVYKVTQPGDCEGHTYRTVGYFSNEALAQWVRKSNYGSQAMEFVGNIEPVTVYSTAADFVADYPNASDILTGKEREDAVRERALKKLTPEEREVLGLVLGLVNP